MNSITRRLHQFTKIWSKNSPEENWRLILTGEHPALRSFRHLLRHLPSNPRCQLCNAPFQGLGGPVMRMLGRGPSKYNPRFCQICLDDAPVGGAEIELTMLFADVRGSTTLAEQMRPAQFGRLINRFFSTATRVLVRTNAIIDRLVGDEVIALYLPAYAGQDHARIALEASKELLRSTGHEDPNGPWIPIGIGVHTGIAFFGKVGHEGVNDITVLGDAANVTARLASQSARGEILLSDATFTASHLAEDNLETREMELKGRLEPMKVWSMSITPG